MSLSQSLNKILNCGASRAQLGLIFVRQIQVRDRIFRLKERFNIAFTANGKRQAEISRLPKTRKIYLVSAYILPVATAMEQVLKTEK